MKSSINRYYFLLVKEYTIINNISFVRSLILDKIYDERKENL
ncbi:hypothetical protein [Oceanivirga miroungae]|nr:hypothetical protein [Oceanivirga miroungae]